MSTRELPERPHLDHLKQQAKSLLRDAKAGDREARQRIAAHHVRALSTFKLAEAQHAIACEYGFESWPKLKFHVELSNKNFQDKVIAFSELAWQWGDRARAQAIATEAPAVTSDSVYNASAFGDVEAVRKFLTQNPTCVVAKGGSRNWPPILYAAWSCFWSSRSSELLDVMRLLLEYGADPNSSWQHPQYDQAESALYGTVEANSVAGARLLLEAGADPNDNESLYHACEKWNLDLLMTLGDYGLREQDLSYCIKHALDMRWPEAVYWFLERGADPNAVHPEARETTLHWAIKRGATLKVIQALLDAGADPNSMALAGHSMVLGRQGNTPLDYALGLGSTEIANLLRSRGAVDSPRSEKEAWIIAAAAGDREEAMAKLRDNPNLQRQLDHFDRSLVAHVAQTQNWSGVRLMIELGWPIDATGWMEARPLTWALCFGNAEMVDFLLARGASLSPAGHYFQSPLHTVVHCRWEKRDQAACLARLLQEGIAVPENFAPCGIPEFDRIL